MNEELIEDFRKAHDKYLESLKDLFGPEKSADLFTDSNKTYEIILGRVKDGTMSEAELKEHIDNLNKNSKDHFEMPRGLCSYACLEDMYKAFAIVIGCLVTRKFDADVVERASEY